MNRGRSQSPLRRFVSAFGTVREKARTFACRARAGITALIGLGVVAGLCVLALSARVSIIEVKGDLDAGEQALVERAIGGSAFGRLYQVDLRAVRRTVVELDWTLDVTVRRMWPDRLQIVVSKPTAVARWGGGGVVTSRGQVVAMPGATGWMRSGGLPLPSISAALSPPERGLEVLQLARQALEPVGLEVAALDENAMSEWRLTTVNAIDVRLGSRSIVDRLQRFAIVYERALRHAPRRVSYVDVRYGRGLAVRWRDPDEGTLLADAGVSPGNNRSGTRENGR